VDNIKKAKILGFILLIIGALQIVRHTFDLLSKFGFWSILGLATGFFITYLGYAYLNGKIKLS
jgi:predicted membrane protein